jgi:hypothetical protein
MHHAAGGRQLAAGSSNCTAVSTLLSQPRAPSPGPLPSRRPARLPRPRASQQAAPQPAWRPAGRQIRGGGRNAWRGQCGEEGKSDTWESVGKRATAAGGGQTAATYKQGAAEGEGIGPGLLTARWASERAHLKHLSRRLGGGGSSAAACLHCLPGKGSAGHAACRGQGQGGRSAHCVGVQASAQYTGLPHTHCQPASQPAKQAEGQTGKPRSAAPRQPRARPHQH